jgi:hypothetical protein
MPVVLGIGPRTRDLVLDPGIAVEAKVRRLLARGIIESFEDVRGEIGPLDRDGRADAVCRRPGGGIWTAGLPEPVATPGEFVSRATRRMVLRSTPVRRSISR